MQKEIIEIKLLEIKELEERVRKCDFTKSQDAFSKVINWLQKEFLVIFRKKNIEKLIKNLTEEQKSQILFEETEEVMLSSQKRVSFVLNYTKFFHRLGIKLGF